MKKLLFLLFPLISFGQTFDFECVPEVGITLYRKCNGCNELFFEVTHTWTPEVISIGTLVDTADGQIITLDNYFDLILNRKFIAGIVTHDQVNNTFTPTGEKIKIKIK